MAPQATSTLSVYKQVENFPILVPFQRPRSFSGYHTSNSWLLALSFPWEKACLQVHRRIQNGHIQTYPPTCCLGGSGNWSTMRIPFFLIDWVVSHLQSQAPSPFCWILALVTQGKRFWEYVMSASGVCPSPGSCLAKLVDQVGFGRQGWLSGYHSCPLVPVSSGQVPSLN